jgi:hypothetical protein
VTVKSPRSDAQLEILHDHYKDTFARIRQAEISRDRLFLAIIGIFTLLIIEIGYPATVVSTLGTLKVVGGAVNLKALPLAALLNATWVLALTVGLRYCQTSVLVNRQYPYLHLLEETLSPAVGGGNLYQREGKVYLESYPLLLNVAWIAYGFLFPIVVMLAVVGLVVAEFTNLPYPVYQTVFDALIAGAIIFVFFVYRVHPSLSSKWRTMRSAPVGA